MAPTIGGGREELLPRRSTDVAAFTPQSAALQAPKRRRQLKLAAHQHELSRMPTTNFPTGV